MKVEDEFVVVDDPKEEGPVRKSSMDSQEEEKS
jgi:hypothetical protein